MNNWQRILKDHDCNINIINENTVIVKNNAYSPEEKRFFDIRLTKQENNFLVETLDNEEVIESYTDSLKGFLGY